MKRAILLGSAIAVLLCLSGLPLMAQGRSGGAGQAGSPGMSQGGVEGQQPGMEQPGMERETEDSTNGPMVQTKTPAQLLMQNPRLSSNLKNLVPAGQNVQDAASGFTTLGEFVAVLHIAHNLNIPFTQLKGKVTSGDSLGKAIQTLNPSMSKKEVKAEVKKGKGQAKEDIKASQRS